MEGYSKLEGLERERERKRTWPKYFEVSKKQERGQKKEDSPRKMYREEVCEVG